jgi:hypothetical protein
MNEREVMIGASCYVGRWNIASQCSKCGKSIWLLHSPVDDIPLCVICGIKDMEISNATDPHPAKEAIAAKLREMLESGF